MWFVIRKGCHQGCKVHMLLKGMIGLHEDYVAEICVCCALLLGTATAFATDYR